MEQRKINKLIIRDSLIAIPTLLFTGAWLVVVLNPNTDDGVAVVAGGD